MTVYAAGAVALATVRGVPNVRIFMADPDSPMEWTSAGPLGPDSLLWHHDRDITDVRPLVVLDHSHIDDALRGLDSALTDFHWLSEDERHAVRELRDQIEAAAKPPRMPEPGLWGVVEAKSPRDAGSLVNDGAGWLDSFGRHFEWADLVDPVLVRPGIEDES